MMKSIKVQGSNHLLVSALFTTINEENIEILVRAFYPRVLQDAVLAPYFIAKLGDDMRADEWEEHLVLLTEFWKFVSLGYDNYTGNPLQPHFHIADLNAEAFSQWLAVFYKTVDTLYAPSVGEYFKQKSNSIAENFMRKLRILQTNS